ncbi:MAG: TonB-dependent receptor, partial [Bacteroidales bacterium]|nr:TonB-dependent receptor [Bacteroidales bacterium]
NSLAGVVIIATSGDNASAGNAVTDINGGFTLSVKKFPVTLKASCLGYKDEALLVAQPSSNVTIFLKDDVTQLEETVVVGYATMKKRDVVGAVEQIDSKAIANRSVGNLSRALQGEITGLNITFNDGKPSRSADINVRGTSSIGAGGSTLVLIDGVEGTLESINPEDVESVSVLKDASSAAVYGARGAFGVILVTTKDAKKGEAKVTYSGNITVNRRTVIPSGITDGKEWLTWWMECYDGYYRGTKARLNHVDSKIPYTEEIYQEYDRRNADPSLSKVTQLQGHDMFGWAYYGNTDWYDEFYKPVSVQTEHNLSVSGGTDKSSYYVSGRFYDFDGIYRVGKENYKKFDLRAKGSIQVTKWLKVTNNMSISRHLFYQPKEQTGGSMEKLINHAAYPVSTIKNPDGTWTPAAAISGYAALAEGKAYRDDKYIYLRNKLSLDIDFIPQVLRLTGEYSYNYTGRKRIDVNQAVGFSKGKGIIQYEGINPDTSYLQQVNYETNYHSGNVYLSYSPKLGPNHSLTALIGVNIESSKYETLTNKQFTYITESKPTFALMSGTANVPTQSGNEWAYFGAFFRVNYGFKSRYLFEVSGRYDGSSKFPAYSQWGFFPSGSFGWRLSEEPWMTGAKHWLDNAKIRLSAGSMGNGNVSPYSYTSEMSIATATDTVLGGTLPKYTSVGGVVPTSLTWERSTTFDVGLDLDFLGNRLSFSGDYYIRLTSDMYTTSLALPAVYGASSPKGNNAEIRTNGWELSLQWRDEFNAGGKPFSYSIKGMVWDYYSVVTKYQNPTKSLGTISDICKNDGTPGNYYVGMTLGEMWGYTSAGLFKDQDDVNNSAFQQFLQSADKVTRVGQLKIKDIDNSGIIDYGDMTVDNSGDLSVIGNILPRFQYGFNISLNWNGIGFSMFWQGIGKKDWYPGPDAGLFWGKYGRPFFAFIPTIHSLSNNTIAKIGVDEAGNEYLMNPETAYWPRLTTYQSNSANYDTRVLETPNTQYKQSVAYLRLKNVQIDYTFSNKLCQKMKIKGLKFYLSGENLLTFTPMHKWAPNFDPEALTYDTDFGSAGDGYTYPVFKSYTFGVNLTF